VTARAEHCRLDRAALEAEARDGGLAGAPADLYRPRRFRTVDLSMTRPPAHDAKVLLLELRERVSSRGTRYLSGWLGKASVVGFLADEPDDRGNPVWRVFVSTPEPRPDPGDGRGRGVARA